MPEIIFDRPTWGYIGIDPGEDGAIAYLGEDGALSVTKISTMTDTDIWCHIGALRAGVYACIEQQTPRPTSFFDKSTGKWVARILSSTVTLYGRYMQARSFLTAAGIPFEDVPPKRWQKGLNIQPKAKSETPSQWKNRLKGAAQQLFPKEHITLATADALLIAEYCRRSRQGGKPQ